MKAPLSVADICWAPPEWACNCFPLESAGQETIEIESMIAALHALADTITDGDSSALGPSIHVAHMLLAWQGKDGMWPAVINGRTGRILSEKRTPSPLTLYYRLAELLETTEFDHVIERSERLMGSTGLHLIREKES